MELKEIEQILDPIPMTGAIQRQIMQAIQAIQAYGKEQYNKALEDTIVNAEIIYGEGILPFLNKQSIRNLKKH